MKKLKLLMGLFFVFLSPIALADSSSSSLCNDKQIMGTTENVGLLEKNLTLPAKLDTGAAMSSLSAENIEVFENNGKTWVRFTIPGVEQAKKIVFVEPFVSYAKILNRSEENANNKADKTDAPKSSKRPIIRLKICFGNQAKETLFNLTDRSQFRYPMLIGADALKNFKVLVDVDRAYLSTQHC